MNSAELIAHAQQITPNSELARHIFSVLDLTNLNEEDNADVIMDLCDQTQTAWGHVAALCIYPRFIKNVRAKLATSAVNIATVANFPAGRSALPAVIQEIKLALEAGAQEIDVVMPYHVFLSGDELGTFEFIKSCKHVCADVKLKVILETGALGDIESISAASAIAIEAGANFIKTSTGKINSGATLEAACAMLQTIKTLNPTHCVGFKAAGGIRNLTQALHYWSLTETILGKADASTLRIGASSLLFDIMHYMR